MKQPDWANEMRRAAEIARDEGYLHVADGNMELAAYLDAQNAEILRLRDENERLRAMIATNRDPGDEA